MEKEKQWIKQENQLTHRVGFFIFPIDLTLYSTDSNFLLFPFVIYLN